MSLPVPVAAGDLAAYFPVILGMVIFACIAGLVTLDAKRRRMNPSSAYGLGMFIVLMAGATLADWLGAAIAGAIGITYYLIIRE